MSRNSTPHPAYRRTVRAGIALTGFLTVASLAQTGAPTPAKPAGAPAAKVLSEDGWNLVERVFGLVLRDYVDPKTPDQVIRGALQGAAAAAGPESAYIPPEQVAAYRAAEAAATTLPLYLTKGDDFARILAVFPSLDKGPERGDFLKSVDGTSTYDLTYPQLLSLLAGKGGAQAKCVFLKREAFETYHLTLPYLPLPEPTWQERPGGAVLTLASLPGEFAPSLRDAIRNSRAGRILVDLRACASGDPRAALRTGGALLGGAPGPKSRGQKGEVQHMLTGAGLLAGKKLRVLVGPGTARGGEVLARALEGSGALLVGETTAGWAPLAETFPLEDGGLLRINTQFFLDREGKEIKEAGLVPTISLSPSEGEGPEAFLDRALDARPTPPAPADKPAQVARSHGA